MRDDLFVSLSNLLFDLKVCSENTERVCVCVFVSELAVVSEHYWALLYIHLYNPLVSSFGHPSTYTAPPPTYILSDDTFPQLPYQCTGKISQKLLAWELDSDVWEWRGWTWQCNTFVWTVKITQVIWAYWQVIKEASKFLNIGVTLGKLLMVSLSGLFFFLYKIG